MTTSADFTAEEWDAVREGPTSAGMIVSTAQRGGSFREAFAMAKEFAEARQEHGDSELLDALVSAKPEMDKTREHSPEEQRQHGLNRIREAVALVEAKGTEAELADYRRFVVSLCERVANAKGEGGEDKVSDAERAAIDEVKGALGA